MGGRCNNSRLKCWLLRLQTTFPFLSNSSSFVRPFVLFVLPIGALLCCEVSDTVRGSFVRAESRCLTLKKVIPCYEIIQIRLKLSCLSYISIFITFMKVVESIYVSLTGHSDLSGMASQTCTAYTSLERYPRKLSHKLHLTCPSPWMYCASG